MKNMFRYAAVTVFCAAVLFVTNGCCNATVSTRPFPAEADTAQYDGMQPAAVGQAANSGYYLFNTWPLYTGNVDKYNRKDYHSFHDDITPARNSNMLLKEMRKKYQVEKLTDVKHQESSWGYFSLWIIWRKTISTSATGLKTPAPEKKAEKNR